MVEKRKVLIDNQELPGLIKTGALPLEEGVVEVAGFRVKRIIKDGITKIPPIELTYKVERSTRTREFLNSWKLNDEVHDVVIVQCDASGQEFGRLLAPQCGMSKLDPGETDLNSPGYAKIEVTLAPWDFKPVKAQA